MKTSVSSIFIFLGIIGFVAYNFNFFGLSSSGEEKIDIDIDQILLSPSKLRDHEILSKALLVFDGLPEGPKKEKLREAICEVAPRLSMCEQSFVPELDVKMLSLDDPIETILPSTRAKNAIQALNVVRRVKGFKPIKSVQEFINFYETAGWERQLDLARGVGQKTKKELMDLYKDLKDIENI